MKKLPTLCSAALIAVVLAVAPGLAQSKTIPAGPIKMRLTEKPVLFDHNIHTTTVCTACHTSTPAHFPPLTVDTETQCSMCHHKVAGIIPKFRCGTVGCHNPRDKHARRSYFKIVHDRKIIGSGHLAVSCLGCHNEVTKTRPEKKQALTSCSGSSCHPKQK